MITDKTYDYKRDYRLIDANTAILLNIFNKRRIDIDASPDKPKKLSVLFLSR